MSTVRDWFAERNTDHDEHPVDAEVRRRAGAVLVEMDERVGKLKAALDDSVETKEAWLELEAALNDRAAIREAAYYNTGVDDGRSHRVVEELLGSEQHPSDPEEVLRILAQLGSTVALLAQRVARTLRGTPRVLLVEDDPLVGRALERLLSKSMDVRRVANAEQAIAALTHDDFDVVLTDYELGGRDGISLLEEVRAARPHVRRVLMSGSRLDAEALISSGVVHAFVPKADDPSGLVPLLLGLLASRR
jgi:CheY-like chemotaxis protein